MQSINFRTARGNLSEVLNNVEAGEEVEITRRGREPAVIVSKATFEAYKKAAALDAEFASLFDTLDSTNKELVNR
jgi:antitoxin Phd